MRAISRLNVRKMLAAVTGRKRPDISARMKAKNPMSNEAAKQKMIRSLTGRTFLSRGGNGQPTEPQILLAQRLRLPMEFAIRTKSARGHFKSLPKCYKVDIADIELKLAIEVDGKTHRLKRWKFLDRRKTKVLNFLGWLVFRVTNEEVMEDMEATVARIHSFLTSE